MKRPILGLAVVCVLAILSKPAVSQNETPADSQDSKHMETTMADGKWEIRLAALRMDKEWAASVIHLRGNVKVEIFARKGAQQTTVLRADEVDYREDTGEILPRGNVRVTVVDRK